MPPCPPGGCHCAWFWIHNPNSGSEQSEFFDRFCDLPSLIRRRVDYMTGFKCNVTGSTSNVPLAKAQLPRRCGADPANGVTSATPGNCTYGAKSPFYWFQAERNNVSGPPTHHETQFGSNHCDQMNEGTYSPPFYTDLYNFLDGAQNDIFENSYDSIPVPSPNQTAIPQLNNSTSNGGMPASPPLSTPIPSSSMSSNTVASSSTPGYVDPAPLPSSSSPAVPPPIVTATNNVYFSGAPTPSSSTATPQPTPPGGAGNPSIMSLNKRKPM